jgi:hypothetical protein
MSRMSDLHLEVQEMLANGHGIEWISQSLNVPRTVVQEIQTEMNDETNDPTPEDDDFYRYTFSETLYVF